MTLSIAEREFVTPRDSMGVRSGSDLVRTCCPTSRRS